MLTLRGVSLRYEGEGTGRTVALDDVDLAVAAGEFVCLRGPSGSGKTSLLLLAGGMLRPTAGRVEIDAVDLYARDANARAEVRATDIGFVFQTFHLVPYLDVADNLRLAGGGRCTFDREFVVAQLERVGLGARATHKPRALSVGEAQRIALLRAILHRPRLVLADEPTGNLDPDNAGGVLDLLTEFHRAGGTVLLVTHGTHGDERADRVLHLQAGRLMASASPDARGSRDSRSSMSSRGS